ncbi:MAG TPA: DoxX family protein [Candidatus Paceibacterota bacterium]|nr:DoxX family protein [Candidatus Paceibacterota bacterium]
MSPTKRGVFLLIVRLIIGGIFIAAGWMKVSAMAMTVGYFAQMGIPAFLAYVVGYVELVGGVLIVLGLWSCLAAFVLAVIMLFAIWYSRSMGFQGMMPPLAVLAGLLSIIESGAGKFSLGKKSAAGEGAAQG